MKRQLKEQSKIVKTKEKKKNRLLKKCQQLDEDDLLQAHRLKSQRRTAMLAAREAALRRAPAAPAAPAAAPGEMEDPAPAASQHEADDDM